ncbi:MAG: transcriptional regulator [Candidatus Methanomethylicota archaeon]|uniref:Transcriptional regulator n=1 Tax=Thermoproteota archaeon TaxID=2056631 RepID=A0A497F0H4_9CREN|nr:MAG: transcriptional regulator [Candidatus Verstraetearchaeota archaeon]
MSSYDSLKEALLRRIVSEIVLADSPGEVIKKWREYFNVTQMELANKLKISPSVISDYESGRRKSPGSSFVKRLTKALLEIDEQRGSVVIRQFSPIVKISSDSILDIREFAKPISIEEISKETESEVVACRDLANKKVLGYTVVESLRAITTMSGFDFLQLFGTTTERVLVFVNTRTGRSPMVAVRVASIKPASVLLYGVKQLDPIAVQLAETERIPLMVTKLKSVEELIRRLRRL